MSQFCRLYAVLVHYAQVSKFDDPHEAALSVVAESYRLWLQVLSCSLAPTGLV
jgi:hypothetical protein